MFPLYKQKIKFIPLRNSTYLLTHLFPIAPFFYTLKTSESLWFSDVFRGWRKDALGTNRLNINRFLKSATQIFCTCCCTFCSAKCLCILIEILLHFSVKFYVQVKYSMLYVKIHSFYVKYKTI